MRVKFWGTRGSIPSPLDGNGVRMKIRAALQKAHGRDLSSPEAIDTFLDELGTETSSTWGGDTSCVEVEASEGVRILCDAGTGLRAFGNSILSSVGPGHSLTYHLLMSHFHWDHVMGLPFFVPSYIPGNRIVVHSCHDMSESAIRHLWGLPGFPVKFEDLGAEFVFESHAEGEAFDVDGYRVTTTRQRHAGDSFGYRLEKDGRSIVYSTDSEHKKDLIRRDYPFLDFIRNADLLIFDAQYSLDEAVSVKEDWGHSSNVIGVDLAHRANVKKTVSFTTSRTTTTSACSRSSTKRSSTRDSSTATSTTTSRSFLRATDSSWMCSSRQSSVVSHQSSVVSRQSSVDSRQSSVDSRQKKSPIVGPQSSRRK